MPTTHLTCRRCGKNLPAAGRGRVPTYCSTRCRVAAHRARRTLPDEMTSRRRWVRREADKMPLQAATGRPASSTDPDTWTSYSTAARSRRGAGLGYVLAADDGIVCIDLDHCLTGGRIADWAQDILDRAPATYTEISPSGTGLHIWGRGHVEHGRRIRTDDGAQIEIYGTGRYIALGERYADAPNELADLSEVIDSLT